MSEVRGGGKNNNVRASSSIADLFTTQCITVVLSAVLCVDSYSWSNQVINKHLRVIPTMQTTCTTQYVLDFEGHRSGR